MESKINENDSNSNTNEIKVKNSNIKYVGALGNHLVKIKTVIKSSGTTHIYLKKSIKEELIQEQESINFYAISDHLNENEHASGQSIIVSEYEEKDVIPTFSPIIQSEAFKQTSAINTENSLVKHNERLSNSDIDIPKCFLNNNDLSELLKENHKTQENFYELLSDSNRILDNIVEKCDLDNLNTIGFQSELSDYISSFFNNFHKITDWAKNVHDSKLYLEFSSTYKEIVDSVVKDFHKNSLQPNINEEVKEILEKNVKILCHIYYFWLEILDVLKSILDLIGDIAEKPTKIELYKLIIGWNDCIGKLRNRFLDGLDSLKQSESEVVSAKLLEKFSQLFEQTEKIFTYFQENLGSQIFVKVSLNSKTKYLKKLYTTYSLR